MTDQAIDHRYLGSKGYPEAQALTLLITVVHLDAHLSYSICVPPILAPLVEEEKRRPGDRELTYLVVFPFLMTLALHLWGGLPVDLVRIKGQTAMLTSISTTQRIRQWCSRVQETLKGGGFQKKPWAGEDSAVQRSKAGGQVFG